MPIIDLTAREMDIVKEALNYRKQAQAAGSAPTSSKADNERETDQILAKLREARQ